jgi:hypothetical protein
MQMGGRIARHAPLQESPAPGFVGANSLIYGPGDVRAGSRSVRRGHRTAAAVTVTLTP